MTPLNRSTPLARLSDKRRAAIEAGEVKTAHNSTLAAPEKPMKAKNPERLARLEEEQYGGYGDHIASLACWVTGLSPVDRAHVLGTRAAGHGPSGLAPLHRTVHRDFDDGLLTNERFFERWEVSRADIRARARSYRAEWEARNA